MTDAPRLRIRRAGPSDLSAILEIENASFSSPWPEEAFEDELGRRTATYLAAMLGERLAGYAGMWCIAGEAHVMNVAVAPDLRRRGIAEALVLALLGEAVDQGAALAYLEHRAGNLAAAALYAKLGFGSVGRRAGYYSDTNEDAILMALFHLDTDGPRHLSNCWHDWEARHGTRPDIDR